MNPFNPQAAWHKINLLLHPVGLGRAHKRLRLSATWPGAGSHCAPDDFHQPVRPCPQCTGASCFTQLSTCFNCINHGVLYQSAQHTYHRGTHSPDRGRDRLVHVEISKLSLHLSPQPPLAPVMRLSGSQIFSVRLMWELLEDAGEGVPFLADLADLAARNLLANIPELN